MSISLRYRTSAYIRQRVSQQRPVIEAEMCNSLVRAVHNV
jgi:hypothetical protein